MRRIQLWMVDGDSNAPRAMPIEELSDTETERYLEDLLVASPEVLHDGLTLVARQLPTQGGPLDLVGVDQDGHLIIFELKRGTLTRDAVAQVIDYASDLAQMDQDDLCRLIEENSGSKGIERIDDFLDWYHRELPDAEDPFSNPPRMVLVGLGADSRATRMVNFLAKTGVDIQLLTFHAFRAHGRLVLGRQVETVKPASSRGRVSGSKENNLAALLEIADESGVRDLLLRVADFIDARLPCYRWPGKTAFSFSLQDRTEEGRPTWRNHMTLYVLPRKPRSLLLTFAQRAAEIAGEAMSTLGSAVPAIRESTMSGVAYELEITAEFWPQMEGHVEQFLARLSAAHRARAEAHGV